MRVAGEYDVGGSWVPQVEVVRGRENGGLADAPFDAVVSVMLLSAMLDVNHVGDGVSFCGNGLRRLEVRCGGSRGSASGGDETAGLRLGRRRCCTASFARRVTSGMYVGRWDMDVSDLRAQLGVVSVWGGGTGGQHGGKRGIFKEEF